MTHTRTVGRSVESFARHHGLEKEMLPGLRDEAEDGREGPSQDPRLMARQRVEGRNPTGEADFGCLTPMKKVEQRTRRMPARRRGSDRVA